VVEPIEWPSPVTFNRWCAALSTRWCTMRVDLDGESGGRIETAGFWICMNKDTLTPSRVTDTLIDRFSSTATEHRLKWRPMLADLAAPDTEVPFGLRRTDIDLFQHVTNTAYWHAIAEVAALVPDICGQPYRAVIEYRRPIRYGESVALGWTRTDRGAEIALTVDGDIRAAALLGPLPTG
jgi:acyl-ACP thioesterase